MNETEIIQQYAHLMIEGMSKEDMYEIVFETISQQLSKYDKDQLMEEIEHFYPELLSN